MRYGQWENNGARNSYRSRTTVIGDKIRRGTTMRSEARAISKAFGITDNIVEEEDDKSE